LGGELDSTDSRNFGPAPFAVGIRLTVMDERGQSETYQTAVDLPTIRTLRNPQTAAPRRHDMKPNVNRAAWRFFMTISSSRC